MYRCLVRYETICHLNFVYGNRLLGNNPFLPDQCNHYAMIFRNYIMNSLSPTRLKKHFPYDFH